MRRFAALAMAAALLSLCACGQDEAGSSSSSSEESSAEVTTAAEEVTGAATEEATEDNGVHDPAEYLQPDDSQVSSSAETPAATESPKLPENAEKLVEVQLEAFRDKDFNKWKDGIGSDQFSAFCDMIKEQAPEDMDPDYPVTQLKSGFDFITGIMPEGFADIDSFAGKLEDIRLDFNEADEQLYSFGISGTDMTGEFGVYHYGDTDIVILNNVTVPEG